MRAEMLRYSIGVEDPKRFSNVLQALQRDNYDCAKILDAFADVDDVRKLRLEVDNASEIPPSQKTGAECEVKEVVFATPCHFTAKSMNKIRPIARLYYNPG
jgi:hypothetical protein